MSKTIRTELHTELCTEDPHRRERQLQMSAWYIFSSLGFYPVTPGSPDYALGSPSVKEAKIHLANGNTLSITAENQSEKNVYVKRVLLNGVPLKGHQIAHQDLMKGGELVFEMSSSYE